MGFQIEVISLDGRWQSFETDRRDVAKPYIPDELRPLVIEIVKDSYIRLIREIEPNTIYPKTTMTGFLPKAMAKHESLTAAIENEGYDIIDADNDRDGRWYWLMKSTIPYER
jgi:hypothetical protein